MPQRIAPPSNAGPAGAAVASTVSPSESTISQLVPTSMNSRVRLSRSMPVASMPATMSPPTYAPSEGKIAARARGCTASPRSAASTDGRRRRRHHERRHPERLGVDAEHQRGHRGVARERHLVDVRRVDAGLRAHLLGELAQGGRGRLLQPAERVGVHHGGADPGDHVAAEGLLLVEHRRDRDRACRSRGRAAWPPRWWCRGRRPRRTAPSVVSPGSTSISVLVDDHGGDLEVGLAQHLRQPAQHGEVAGAARGRRSRRAAGPGRCAGRRGSARRARRTASARPAAGSPAGPTPTVAALGRVVSGGTSTARSRVA